MSSPKRKKIIWKFCPKCRVIQMYCEHFRKCPKCKTKLKVEVI